MSFQRRQLLRLLSTVFASGFISPRNRLGAMALPESRPTLSPPAEAALSDGSAGETVQEKVTGIGGFFFRAHDPAALGHWYQQHLGIALAPTSYQDSPWQQEAGPTIFEAQPETSDLFGDSHKVWSMNFRVRNLDKMAAQLTAAGIKVDVDPQSYPNGRFASLHDPEGNPIQLWQPK